jgi:hypothetical protein
MTVLTLTTGTTLIMWLGEQITERGIGNGMSLIIYAGIVVNGPHAILTTFDPAANGSAGPDPADPAPGRHGGGDCRDHFRGARQPAASPCSTRNVWSAGACTAARARTFR